VEERHTCTIHGRIPSFHLGGLALMRTTSWLDGSFYRDDPYVRNRNMGKTCLHPRKRHECL